MRIILLLFAFFSYLGLLAQDTTIVQTFTYDSTSRSAIFQFPIDENVSYEKIIMQYSMRCHDNLVGNGAVGCREWDYSCNTVLTDPSQTDSLASTHPNYTISNFDGEEVYDYTTQPTYSYLQYIQQEVTNTNIIDETISQIGTGDVMTDKPFPNTTVGKTQFLWTAEELMAAGVVAGSIDGITLDILEAQGETEFLKIKMRATTQTALTANAVEIDGFTEVYFLNTTLPTSGEMRFNFYQPFEWNGTSNILVEFSHNNTVNTANPSLVSATEVGYVAGLHTNTDDYYLEFTGSENVNVPTNTLSGINEEITISFWSYGNPQILPANTSVFEAFDAEGNRQANCHLPWSNGQVYWDCGNDGDGYDRINNTANEDDFKGRWNHWAMTKNTNTGNMRLFVNGVQLQAGNGKNKPIALHDFFIGQSATGTNPYFGKVNEFRIWDTALTQTTIRDWMYKSIDFSHPNYANLLGYYRFDEGIGNTTSNNVTDAIFATIQSPNWHALRGEKLFSNFNEMTTRPNVGFIQGEYEQTIETYIYLDSIENVKNTVIGYGLDGNDLISLDTTQYYEAGYSYVYDQEGVIIVDSVFNDIEGSLNIETLDYYNKWESRLELLSFVTPYGNGLDLGPEGKMWEFDVTDFSTALTGEKMLSIEGTGNYQEEYGIRFLFIEGIPPRDVLNIQSVWPIMNANQIWYGVSYEALANNDNNRYEPRNVNLQEDAEQFKVRVAVTGHGQNGEFIPRTHFFDVNGGDKEFEWSSWKECSLNPVYPQGGTWLFDRAGWCPGMATDVQEFDISDMVSAGEAVNLDYGIYPTGNMSEANYRPSVQLVSYGAPNFMTDAAIINVKRPSNLVEFGRINSACKDPIIEIKNTGANTLTSLNFDYYVNEDNVYTYEWTGSLEFLETTEVILPIENVNFWFTDNPEKRFYVNISNPNGTTDEYENNNHYISNFDAVTEWDSGLMSVNYRTNNRASENSYTLKDHAGNIILSRDNMENATTYDDEIELATNGCFSLSFTDTGDDGLDYWYWAAVGQNVGTGWLRLKDSDGNIVENFEPDFGRDVFYNFSIFNPDFENNTAPSALDDFAATVINLAVDIDVLANDSDAESDELSILSNTEPSNGTLTLEDNIYTYLPNNNFTGEDSFTYSIYDGNGGTAMAVVNITIGNPPMGSNDMVNTSSDMPVEIDVLANDNDEDGDDLTVCDFTESTDGTLTLEDNIFTFTPNEAFTGTATFTYYVCDASGGIDSSIVYIAVSPASTSIENLPYRLFSTYPNPSKDVFNIELHGYQQRLLNFKIYNAVGQLIYQEELYATESILKHSFDLSEAMSGVYLLKMDDGTKVRTKQLVKE